MKNRKILVTGGAGFIGSHLVEALVDAGHSVRVVDNFSTGSPENLEAVSAHIQLREGDICDEGLMAQACRGAEYVFHQAALASVPLSVEQPLKVNRDCVTGTVTVLDQARRAGVRRVIYAASSSCYGDGPFDANRENDLPRPLSPYAAAKLAGEHYCQAFYHAFGLETVGLRYFNVFGPRQDPNSPYSAVIPIFISQMLRGQSPTVFGDGKQTRDFTYVSNVVDANLLTLSAPNVAGRYINVANGSSSTLLDLIFALQQLLDVDSEIQFQPPRAGDIRDSRADITLARQLLGYRPRVDLVAGLDRTIHYYRQIVGAPFQR